LKQVIKSGAIIAALVTIIILLSINHQRALKVASSSQANVGVAVAAKQAPVPLQSAVMPLSLTPVKSCNVEEIDGIPYIKPYEISRAENIVVSGWLLDTETRSVPREARLYVIADKGKGAWSAPLKLDLQRSDVASLNGGLAAYQHSGFSVDVDIKRLASGAYHLLLVYGQSGHGYVCDNGRILRIET